MATIYAVGGGGLPDGVLLSNAQTGNGVSTNVVDRGGGLEASLLEIVSTVGATPTVNVDIQGSADGSSWWNVAYTTAPAPSWVGAHSLSALVITTATTTRAFISPDQPWRFLRLNYSANTNVTLTSRIWIF